MGLHLKYFGWQTDNWKNNWWINVWFCMPHTIIFYHPALIIIIGQYVYTCSWINKIKDWRTLLVLAYRFRKGQMPIFCSFTPYFCISLLDENDENDQDHKTNYFLSSQLFKVFKCSTNSNNVRVKRAIIRKICLHILRWESV